MRKANFGCGTRISGLWESGRALWKSLLGIRESISPPLAVNFLDARRRVWTQKVNGVDFLNSGSRFLAPESQFTGNGIRFLACGRQFLAVVVEL